MMEIVVDVHEQKSGIIEQLQSLGMLVHQRHLDAGDYLINGWIGVERKTISDFATSLVRGRLFAQLVALQAAVSRPALIVEGDRSQLTQRLHPNSVRGTIVTVSVKWGVPILWSLDIAETATYLHLLTQQTSRPRLRWKSVIPHKSKDKETLQRNIVSQIPQVGTHNAEMLLKHFGNLEEIFGASENEIQEVKGIGGKKATTIYHVLHK